MQPIGIAGKDQVNPLEIKLQIQKWLPRLESEIREPMDPAMVRDAAFQIAILSQKLVDIEKARIQLAIEETNP